MSMEPKEKYKKVFQDLVDHIQFLTDKKVYKALPDIEGLELKQIDNLVATHSMELIMSLKRNDRDQAFTYYSMLISKVRKEHLHELLNP